MRLGKSHIMMMDHPNTNVVYLFLQRLVIIMFQIMQNHLSNVYSQHNVFWHIIVLFSIVKKHCKMCTHFIMCTHITKVSHYFDYIWKKTLSNVYSQHNMFWHNIILFPILKKTLSNVYSQHIVIWYNIFLFPLFFFNTVKYVLTT